MLSAFREAFAGIGRFDSRLSPRIWPGNLSVRLNAPGLDTGTIRFTRQSAGWVRQRTGKAGGVHEPGLVKSLIALRGVLGPLTGADVYDIGALHGYVAFMAAEILAPRRVLAFEMNPEAAQLARRNAALNGGSRVEVIHAGVSDRSTPAVPCLYQGFALNVMPDADEAARLRAESYSDADIDLLSLDDVTRAQGCAPKLIKIDVEGSQMTILRGAGEVLRSFRPVLLVEADGPKAANTDGTPMAALCTELMTEFGYDIAMLDHRSWDSGPRPVTQAMIDKQGYRLERNLLLVCLPRD